MSKQRQRHWIVVINEEADKAVKRGIPFSCRPVWVEASAAKAYRKRQQCVRSLNREDD